MTTTASHRSFPTSFDPRPAGRPRARRRRPPCPPAPPRRAHRARAHVGRVVRCRRPRAVPAGRGARRPADDGWRSGLFRAIETSVWLSVPLAWRRRAQPASCSASARKWGVVRHWWVVLKEVAVRSRSSSPTCSWSRPPRTTLPPGHPVGLLDPAIAHCVVLALATVVSIVKPFGRRHAVGAAYRHCG